ncbi:BC_2427 family protein [Bacillus nitratireducens]|uniref:BC_2427 family protein n=1 Tax=Bacillus nitratireducens TaxID=2026193 RepID=UPI003D20D79D
MDKPLVGKGIWNKVYKEKMLNVQDDSREIREKKKSKEIESKKEDKVIGIEKESEKTGLTKVNKAIGLEEEEVKIESVKEYEERELEKEEITIESNKESEETEPAKENKVIGLEKVEVANESEKKSEETGSKRESIGLGSKIETSVHSMVVKTPFSIISEVSSFKVFPKINVKNQDAFVFRNEKDAEGRELDSKLLTTVQQYHSEAYCKLVSLNLHEKRVLVELYNQKVKGNNEENKVETSSWIPIHSIILESENGGEVSNYITARLPIEVGRYKGEISLREKVVFTEKVIGIKEVEQEIVLTKTEFLVPRVKKNGQNKFIVEKGSLLVEGYIYQCIEYLSEQSTFHDNVYQLVQNIVLELIIQVIQEQEVQVRIT